VRRENASGHLLRGRAIALQRYAIEGVYDLAVRPIYDQIARSGCLVIVDELSLFHEPVRAMLADSPFPSGGHILCIGTPVRRGGPANSGGTPGPNCDGFFSLDINEFASGNYMPGFPTFNPAAFLLVAGTQVNVQWWGRDTVPTGSFMSDAVQFFTRP